MRIYNCLCRVYIILYAYIVEPANHSIYPTHLDNVKILMVDLFHISVIHSVLNLTKYASITPLAWRCVWSVKRGQSLESAFRGHTNTTRSARQCRRIAVTFDIQGLQSSNPTDHSTV